MTNTELNSKREIERYEAKLNRLGFRKHEFGKNEDGYVNHWKHHDGTEVEVSVDNYVEGRKGMTGYASVKKGK